MWVRALSGRPPILTRAASGVTENPKEASAAENSVFCSKQ